MFALSRRFVFALVLVAVLISVLVGSAIAAPAEKRTDPICPVTDSSGQLFFDSGFNAAGRPFCEYGDPYDIKFLCPTHNGKFAIDAFIRVGGSDVPHLRCVFEGP